MTRHSIILSRSEILDRIREQRDHSFIAVHAPAGFGKTMFARQWQQRQSFLTGWLEVGEAYSEPTLFWEDFLSSFASIDIRFAGKALAVGKQAPMKTLSLDFICKEIESLGKPAGLVIDNYHLINHPKIYELVEQLVPRLPDSFRLMILSRHEDLLRLNGAVHVTKSDLRFSEEQSWRFFAECLDAPLSDKEFTDLYSWTKGWAGGTQLIALMLQEYSSAAVFMDHFSGEHRYLNEYFCDQVFSDLPLDRREFLLNSAVPDQFDATILEGVTDEIENRDLMYDIIRRDLFLVPCKGMQGIYRYEPLFHAFLRHQLRKMPDGDRQKLYERASVWCAGHGLYQEAVDYSIEAGRAEETASLIVHLAPALLEGGEWSKMEKWTALTERISGRQKAEVCLFLCWVHFLKGAYGSFKEVLMKTEKAIHECRLPDGFTGELAFLRSLAAFAMKDVFGAIERSDKAFQLLHDGGVYWESPMKLNTGESEIVKGRMGQNGRLTTAYEFYRHLERYRSYIPETFAGFGSIAKAEMLYEWNKLGEARISAEKALSIAGKQKNLSMFVPAIIIYTKIQHIGSNETNNLLRIEKEKIVAQKEVPLWELLLNSQQVRLLLLQGKVEEADRLMRDKVLYETGGPDQMGEFENLTYVRLLIAEKHYDQAQLLVEQSQFSAESEDRYGTRIEILILQTVIFAKTHRVQMAAKVLLQALSLGEKEGYVRSFLDQGEPIYQVLRYIEEHQLTQGGYFRELLDLFRLERHPTVAEVRMTKREQDVLTMIARGLTNMEMAGEMKVTLGTVKGYTVQLYKKLDVHSRTQAVARGRELNILG